MEDFIGRVGQSYLEREAFAVPQQLENFDKTQLTGGAEKEANSETFGKKTTRKAEEGGERERWTRKKEGRGETAGQKSSSSSEKDMEIARLKRQLAHWKFENAKASTERNLSGPKESGMSRVPNGRKALTRRAAKGDKERKRVTWLGDVGAAGGEHEDMRGKSGEEEAGGSQWGKEAEIVETSATRRRTSANQHSTHGAVAQAEHGGHAKSAISYTPATSGGEGRASTATRSDHGSTVKSIAAASENKHLPAHAERRGETGVMVESRGPSRRVERDSNPYTVEVKEEVAKGRRQVAGGVVEVEASKGRRVYRVG